MTKFPLPKIVPRKNDNLWLEAVYEANKVYVEAKYRTIRIKLIGKIPVNYDNRLIDNRIANHSGMRLTLLGVHIIDPKSNIIEDSNSVINCIKGEIISNPEIKEIDSISISEKTGIENGKVRWIFELINLYGNFRQGASSSSANGIGWDKIRLFDDNQRIDDSVFNEYLSFECIEKLILEFHKEEEYKKNLRENILENKTSSKKDISNHQESLTKITPIFKTRINHIDHKLCFVLMSFTKDWSDRVYKNFIRDNIEDLGLQCLRADNLTGQIIIEDIWIKINQAAFIIADVTDKNPNVMYELGIAHTLGKPVILITQDTTTIPFDFKHLRHYEYADNSDGKDIFKAKLDEVIKNIYQEYYPNITINFQ